MTTPKSASEILADRITAIEPRLRRLASAFAHDAFQADDLYQDACLRILRTCTPDDSDSTIYLRAKSAMRNTISVNVTYLNHVAVEDQIATCIGEDTEDITGFSENTVWEYYRTEQDTPEQIIIEHEELARIHALIDTLSPDNQKVVKMLADGVRQADIARELGCSRAAVSIRLARIAVKLSA